MSAEPTDDAGRDLLPDRPASSEAAVLDGGRRTVVVSPDEVWSAPEPHPATPEEVRREARRSFFAPIVTAVAISTALLLAFIAALALLIRLRS